MSILMPVPRTIEQVQSTHLDITSQGVRTISPVPNGRWTENANTVGALVIKCPMGVYSNISLEIEMMNWSGGASAKLELITGAYFNSPTPTSRWGSSPKLNGFFNSEGTSAATKIFDDVTVGIETATGRPVLILGKTTDALYWASVNLPKLTVYYSTYTNDAWENEWEIVKETDLSAYQHGFINGYPEVDKNFYAMKSDIVGIRDDMNDQLVNLLRDSGRFMEMDSHDSSTTATTSSTFTFNGNGIIKPYATNGGTIEEEGFFDHNNITFGGIDPELSIGVKAIMDAPEMTGRNKRYGTMWFTAVVTAGTGTISTKVVIDGVTYYRSLTGSLHAGGRKTTISYWFVALDAPVAVYGISRLNPDAIGWHLVSPGDGAVYVTSHITNNTLGYNVYPRINTAQAGHRYVLGHMFLGNGIVYPKPTWHPIPSIDMRM